MTADAMDHLGSHDSRAESALVVTTTTFVLASLLVAARLGSRFGVLRHGTADDYVMALAWVLALGMSCALAYGTKRGLGRPDVDIPQSWIGALRGSQYAFTILYNPALMATKTSILIFYLRISRNTQKMLRRGSYGALAVVNSVGLVLTFLNALQCDPVRAGYGPLGGAERRCIPIVMLYLCSAPANIMTDLAILVLPIPVLTGIRLPPRQKAVLVFTFGLGVFVTIVDVIRIYYLQQAAAHRPDVRSGAALDLAWASCTALMWSAVEVNVGIICACIPTLRPLMSKILPGLLTGEAPSGRAGRPAACGPPAKPGGPGGPGGPAEAPIQPLSPAHVGCSHEEEVGMMDFLTTPPEPSPPFLARAPAGPDNAVYFGFVDLRRPPSMLQARAADALRYGTVVAVLFFLWGFSYGLLHALNAAVAPTARQALGLTAAYFGAYLVGALTVGQYALRRGGFRATFVTGLGLYGVGTLVFWPSAVLAAYPGFLVANFVVGLGLSVLETAANPFLALCGPPAYAESRLLAAQGVQAIGSLASQLLAQKVLVRDVAGSLIDVQWTYLAVALLTVALALFFYYVPLPEASDAELEALAEEASPGPRPAPARTPLARPPPPRRPLGTTSLALAVAAQFLYAAAQESVAVHFRPLLASLAPPAPAPALPLPRAAYASIAHTLFALSRFCAAALTLYVAPRLVLLGALLGALVFSAITTFAPAAPPSWDPSRIADPALMIFFFEGPLWPLIFALGLRGMGRRTKLAAAGLTAAASGGAVFPGVMLGAQSRMSVQGSFCVVVALFGAGLAYPLYLSGIGAVRRSVDPVRGRAGHLLPRGGAGPRRRSSGMDLFVRKS
ncbi:unnamed protein product [Diplocarpon coronariae]